MNFDCPSFILKGNAPYKVIEISSGCFMAIDMIDSKLVALSPPSYHDPYENDTLWIGYSDFASMKFEATHGEQGIHFEFHYNDKYQIHCETGPAIIKTYAGGKIEKTFWLNSVQFENVEDWFNSLDDKKKALFNIDEWVE